MMYRPYWIEGEAELHKKCHGIMRCFSLSSDNSLVAIGSDDGWVMVYDTATGHSVQKSLLSARPHHAKPVSNFKYVQMALQL